MALDIRYMTIQIGEETHCCHYMGYSFQLAARVLLYAPSRTREIKTIETNHFYQAALAVLDCDSLICFVL